MRSPITDFVGRALDGLYPAETIEGALCALFDVLDSYDMQQQTDGVEHDKDY
jgi:hypothetical protein